MSNEADLYRNQVNGVCLVCQNEVNSDHYCETRSKTSVGATYYILKREKCPRCLERAERLKLTTEQQTELEEKGIVTVFGAFRSDDIGPCGLCGNRGYTEEPIDLLEVLGKLRWDVPAHTNPNYITEIGFANLRIEE